MKTSLVLTALLFVLGLQPAIAAPADGSVPATLTKRVPPRYPAKAVERGEEGWVHLEFTITPEGTTSDIRLIASYPHGVFDRTATNAVARWIYAPRRENGTAVPQPDNQAVLSFALAESTSIRDALANTYATVASEIMARNWGAAQKLVDTIAATPGLRLYELAALEHLRGRIAFGRGDYHTAAGCLTRALSINAHFGAETRVAISQMLVVAAVNARQFARALEAFDSWNPPDLPQVREMRRTIEMIRAAKASGKSVDAVLPPQSLR